MTPGNLEFLGQKFEQVLVRRPRHWSCGYAYLEGIAVGTHHLVLRGPGLHLDFEDYPLITIF